MAHASTTRSREASVGRWSARKTAAVLVMLATTPTGCAFWGMSDWSAKEESSLADDAGAGADGADVRRDAGSDARDEVAAEIPVLARDSFSRGVQNGFGVADVGGPWDVGLSGGAVSVGDGTGFFGMLAPSAGPFASLPEVASDDLDLQLVVTSGKIGDGGGLYLTVQTRRIDKTRSYTGRIAVRADGTVDGAIARENGTDPTFLGRASDLFVLTAGAPARMRVQATGTRPTRLRLKSWLASEPEPSAWAIDVMDSEPAWQAKGTVGLTAFLSSTATNAPFDVRIDDLLVRPASRLP